MSAKHIIKSEPRTIIGRKVKTLRKQGLVPVNVYGRGITSQSLQIKAADFQKLYKQVGESTLVYLDERPVLVRNVTRHPVSGQILHIDFNQVNLKEKVKAQVKVVLVGESPAVKESKGILVAMTDHVEIEALPADMPEHIEVDISGLAEAGQAVTIKEVKLNKNLVVLDDSETELVRIEELAKEEVKEVAATPETPAAVEATPANETTPGPAIS